MKTILITGTSGFIGFHVARKILNDGSYKVVGYDNENDYYDVNLKYARRHILEQFEDFTFIKGDLSDYDKLESVFKNHDIDRVCHLAAQAGVRYSIQNPGAYIKSNLIGFYNIIELATQFKVSNFVYASSSSVYGANKKQPFSVDDRVDNPISLYAATKKSDELIAHAYSHIHNLPTTGLRFFTVQGPYGRPDMAYFKFTKKIFDGEPIDVYNQGQMERDFTDIDDIVDGVIRSINTISHYELLNLGNDTPTALETLISLLEKYTGKKAIKNYMEMQPGDVKSTWADIEHTKEVLGWQPQVKIEKTIEKFVDWYKDFYNIK